MTIRGKAYIVGAYEHPDRIIPDKSTSQITAEIALGALNDAGLTLKDVDAYYYCGDLLVGGLVMAEYLGLNLKNIDSTNVGGSSPLYHVGHAAAAIAAGKCNVALITLANRPKSANVSRPVTFSPDYSFVDIFGTNTVSQYALAAKRHMYEFGTTSEQLAEVKVAASTHAQYNAHALLQNLVTVEEVVNSRMMSDPLHLLDCCVVTDGGGAIVVVSPEVAASLPRHKVKILGQGEAPKHTMNGRVDLTFTGARWSGPIAFEEAGISHSDIDYASIYDSFTITVVETIEDLGFCEKGDGGTFVMDGALQAPHGKLPFNTDGGGLCSNHPSRGGITKIIEAVRQLRGETAPQVQVPDCQIALVHGTGGSLGTRMGSSTLILGQEDA
jgi:acetyl-CoA C-acetyltransferase